MKVAKNEIFFNRFIQDRPSKEETRAATLIQKIVRGHIARKPFLPRSYYPVYKKQYDELKAMAGNTGMPRANGGKTVVYLPEGMPSVVLKETGKIRSEKVENIEGAKRFAKMLKVRMVLSSQNSTHLVIPRARSYREFLVESRLPINISVYHNIRIYSTEPELFDDAVREMTRLFSKITFCDLLGNQKTVLNEIVGNTVRYDNLPLYIEEEAGKRIGKIGLIDLEHTIKKSGNSSLQLRNLENLARIFPLHIDIVIGEAKNLGTVFLERPVRDAAVLGRRYIEEGYTKYHIWLEERKITTSSVLQINVSAERLHDLELALESKLLLSNRGVENHNKRIKYDTEFPKSFLRDDPEKSAKKLAKYFTPLIVKELNHVICERNKRFGTSTVNSEADMMEARTVVLNNFESHIKLSDQYLGEKMLQTYVEKSAEDITIRSMICVVLEELKKYEIYEFDPNFKTSHGWMSLRF